jgi:hypothetical protein
MNIVDEQKESFKHGDIIFGLRVFTVCLIVGTWILQCALHLSPHFHYIWHIAKACKKEFTKCDIEYSKNYEHLNKYRPARKKSKYDLVSNYGSNCSLISLFTNKSDRNRKKPSPNKTVVPKSSSDQRDANYRHTIKSERKKHIKRLRS